MWTTIERNLFISLAMLMYLFFVVEKPLVYRVYHAFFRSIASFSSNQQVESTG